jgi:two-component system, NarL family, nitrate/nitrite response regulator NarL
MGSALVCDTQLLFAQSLGAAVRSSSSTEVRVQVLTDPQLALKAVQQAVVDVLVVSLRHPEAAWVEAIRAVTALRPTTRVVCLVEPGDQGQAHRARVAGAHRVLSRATPLEEVRVAVTARHAGSTDRPLPAITGVPQPPVDHLRFLSPRERQTLELLRSAQSTQEIAATLDVTTATARGYVQGVLDKLGVHSRVEAVAYAARATAQA